MKSSVLNIDCMLGMKDTPDNFYDLAVVDPPYGLGKIDSIVDNKSKEWNALIPTKEYFDELYRVSLNQIIWGANYYGANIIHVGRLIHHKKLTPFLKGQKSDCDIASQSFDNRIMSFEYQWCGNVQNGLMNIKMEENIDKGIEKRIHPTQKPVRLYEWIFKNYAEEGMKILDTHLGSGSSRIAAYNYKMDFTGYELDKDYFDASEKRFQNHIAQLKLFA